MMVCIRNQFNMVESLSGGIQNLMFFKDINTLGSLTFA